MKTNAGWRIRDNHLLHNTILVILAIFFFFFISGCRTYHHNFYTVINENGEVNREIEFFVQDKSKKTSSENNELVLGAPFDSQMIIPLKERFDVFELSEGRFYAKWHSNGVIHTDFKYQLPISKEFPFKEERGKVKYAYNEGRVIVHDFALLKDIIYVERFHDFNTSEELDRNLDALTDILADLFLRTLEKDLGRKYDLKKLNEYVNDVIVPYVKHWNSPIYSDLENVFRNFFIEGKKPVIDSKLKSEIIYDMMKLGILDSFDFTPEQFSNSLAKWVENKIQELIVSKRGNRHISIEEIERYFGEGIFYETFKKEVEKKYGKENEFEEVVISLLGSFALQGFPFDTYRFKQVIVMPGIITNIFPEQSYFDGKKVDQEHSDSLLPSNLIVWEFSDEHFFESSIILKATSVVPCEANQQKLFGRVIFNNIEDMQEYIDLCFSVDKETRESFFNGVKTYLDTGSINGLNALIRDEYEKYERYQDLDYDSFMNEMVRQNWEGLMGLCEFFEETEMMSLLKESLKDIMEEFPEKSAVG